MTIWAVILNSDMLAVLTDSKQIWEVSIFLFYPLWFLQECSCSFSIIRHTNEWNQSWRGRFGSDGNDEFDDFCDVSSALHYLGPTRPHQSRWGQLLFNVFLPSLKINYSVWVSSFWARHRPRDVFEHPDMILLFIIKRKKANLVNVIWQF